MTRFVIAGAMPFVLAAVSCAASSAGAGASTTPTITLMPPAASTAEPTSPIATEPAEAAPPGGRRASPEPAEALAARAEPPLESTAPRHRSKVLDGAARPSAIAPGDYMCRVDATYKLRPCTVTLDDRGFTWLDAPGGLVHLKGVLYDDARAVVFDGASGEDRPFGCFSCQSRCTETPSTCACQELMPEASRECLARPLTVRLSKKGRSYVGTLSYTTYSNRYEGNGDARHVAGWEPQQNAFLVEIAPAPRAKP